MKISGTKQMVLTLVMVSVVILFFTTGVFGYSFESVQSSMRTKVETTITNHVSDLTNGMVEVEW